MALRPGETPDSDEFAAEDEASERTFNDRTAARPVFTPAAREAADDVTPADAQEPIVAEPAGSYLDDDPAGGYLDDDEPDEPVVEAPAAPAAAGPAPAAPAAGPAPVPVADPDLDQPLLSGDAELLARWQRVQAGFIDDPQAAVADAADLIEQAGQALVDALRQRQRQVRTLWEHGPANGSAGPAGARPDTEQLRQVMRRYRVLFDQLYPAA